MGRGGGPGVSHLFPSASHVLGVGETAFLSEPRLAGWHPVSVLAFLISLLGA